MDRRRFHKSSGYFKRGLKEPLFYFIGMGLLLYGATQWVTAATVSGTELRFSPGRVAEMRAEWVAAPEGQRASWEIFIQGKAREEILVREGLLMGLEQGDPVVRRRVAQKMGYVIEALVEPSPASEEELRAWYAQHQERFMSESMWSITHVFFDGEKHVDAERLARSWLEGSGTPVGDSFVHGSRLPGQTRDGLVKKFGTSFYDGLAAFTSGQRGVLRSKFGWHGVIVESHVASTVLRYEVVRKQVQADWATVQRRRGEEVFWQDLESRYLLVLPDQSKQ